MKFKFVRASRALGFVCAKAMCAALLFLGVFALPRAASADGCTPVTSTASPVTNSTVTCTGVTLNQNSPLGLNTGYGTFNETGDTIDVQTMASVTGDTFGFALGDGNTVDNSGSVTGGTSSGISTVSGSNVIVNNLTAASTISSTSGVGLNVTNVVLSNAGTISGGSDGIIAAGNVVLTSNTGSIVGTSADAEGIFANSVSGSNAGTISGVVGIDTSFGTDVNLSSNSGTIQANGGFAINSKGDVFIGANSGTIARDGLAGTHIARAINAGGSVTVTNTSTGSITATNALNGFGDAIVAVGDATVVNSGNISGDGKAIDAQSLSSTGLSLINNFGGSITGGSGDAVDGVGAATITNAGIITSQLGNGVFIGADANITNTSTGVVETTGTDAEAVIAGSLLLNNAGIVRVTNTTFFAVDVTSIQTGSTNSGTISGNLAAINADDSIDMTNSGTITGGILAIQVTNTASLANLGTISGDRRAIVADDVEITNSGTISATGASGLQAIAIVTLTGNITNAASGTISAAGTAANNDAINAADTTTIDNSGMISSTGRSGVRVGGNTTIINEAGGTIIGVTGIVFRDATGMNVPVVNGSVFNAGTITGTGGVAINFAFTSGSGPMTLTLAPGFVINGTVLGTGADTLQLGGKGSDTFNVDNIGATQQYQGFVTFNKTGGSIWTLTGTGTQSWSILSGTLIGDTNSLGAATYPVSAGATLEFKQDFDGTYSGVVSGGGGFAKDGAGVLTLTGENNYTGGTTILGGTLQIGDGGTTGSLVGDVVDNATFAVNQSSDGVYSGVISGIGDFVKDGTGTLTLTGVSTYGSGTFIDAGTLALAGSGSIENSSLVSVSGTFDVSNAAGGVSIQALQGNGSIVLGANSLTLTNADSEFGGVISGTGGLVLSAGNETLAGVNSYTGVTTITSGTLALVGRGSIASSSDVFDNATFDVSGAAGNVSIQSLDGDGSVILNNSSLTLTNASGVFSGSTSGAGGFVLSAGNITLTGDNSYTGGTTINGGSTLQVGNGGASGSIIGDIVDNGTLGVDRSDFVLADNTISGAGALFQVGSGVLVLAGTDTYTGGTTIRSGTLQIGNGGTTGSIVGDVVDNATLVFDRSDAVVFSGAISGTGSLIALGSGSLTLTGTYSYSGQTTIVGSIAPAGLNGGQSAPVGVSTLVLAGGKNTLNGDIDDEGALVGEATSLVLNGNISGAGSLSVVGGTTTLAGNNSYSGGTTVTNATLSIASDANLGTGGLTLENGSTLALTSTFDLTHAISVAGDPTFDVSGSNIVLVTAPITDGAQPGDVVKTGTGALVLGAPNTYTGGTFVNAGTLQLGDNGDATSIVGPVTVAANAEFDVVNANFSQVTTVTVNGGVARFELSSSAGTAQIASTNNGTVVFTDNATAGQAQISLDNSIGAFMSSASVGNATIGVGNNSLLVFAGSATAANGIINVTGTGDSVVFFNSSTAANAQINVSAANAQIAFELNALAGHATISFSQLGLLLFTDMASADHARVNTTAGDTVEFLNSSTGANALIDATGGGSIIFFANSSAGQAQIALGNNATLTFFDNSSGGSAAVTTTAGTQVDIASLENGGTTIGSINGAGNVFLGENTLTLGSDNSFSTIGGTIADNGGLIKAGSGSLTLTGFNTFTGLTTISGGVLQLGNGGAGGTLAGDIVDNAILAFDRSSAVVAPGAITGTGSVVQAGTGTTILTNVNTYTGGTTISAGQLQIGNGSTTGSIVGDVVDNGTLAFDRVDTVTFGGAISGSGGLVQAGPGTLILTGSSNFTGGTLISAGTLQVGTGGTTGSIVGNVVDNGTLVVDRSDVVLADGSVSGTGSLVQAGSGVLILSADNIFTGGTTINNGGTLQTGNGGTTGSVTGNVVDNGTLIFDRSNIQTFAGAISGSGGVAESGTSTLILTGTNTYTGGTTIASGDLEVGNGGNTGSITGDVVDNGTLVFDRSDTVTFPGAISGSGAVVQNGSGTLILTGTSGYTSTTTVNAGILDVNGSIASSAVTVNGGATLKGNGTVGSLTLASGSTVAPGNSIGTLHVAGNVSFAAGSIYSVELNAAGQSDLIAATGAATIAPGALVDISAAPGIYAAMTHYVILTASGGVTGTFATPSINQPLLVPTLTYLPTEVDLTLTVRNIDFGPLTHTPNEIATAAAVKAGGPQSVIYGQFLQNSLSSLAFVTNALDQLSGEIHPSLVTEELDDSRLVQLSILSRLRQASTGDASGMLAPAPAEAREIVDGVSMWTHAFADWGTLESDGNVATLDQNLSGILAGIDARIGAFNIGLAGGYSHSHANQRNSTAKGGNSYVAAYGGWVDGALALRVGGTYGWGNRNTLRTVVFPGFAETLTSKEDQHASQVFGEAAYAVNMEHLSLEPFAGITWDDASTGPFAEQGGAAALSGKGGDTSAAYSSLGVRLAARPVGADALSVTPRASLAWQHAFGGLHPGQILSFEDTGQSFLALGSTIDSDSADVALGFDAQIGWGAALSFGYEGILSSRVRLNTLHAGLSWNF